MLLQEFRKCGSEFRMFEPHVNRRLQVSEFGTAIETPAFVTVRQHLFLAHQCGDAVSELYFAAGAFSQSFQIMEYPCRQTIRQIRYLLVRNLVILTSM